MGTYTITKVLGAYELISGGFSNDGASYFQGIVGNGVNATQTTSDYYSNSTDTNAVFTYVMSFSDLPSDMTNISCSLSVNGHPENPSSDDEYMCVQLKSGSTNLTEKYNFKSSGTTENTTYALSWSRTPTRAQLQNLVLECTLGWYGGAINGATLYLTYTSSTAPPSSSTHAVYFGYGNQAKKVSKIYFGYGNQAKKVKKGYIGIGGVAKLFYTAEEPLTYTYTGNYTTSTVGTYTVLKITGSGTLTFSRDCSVDIWLCGGGGNGSSHGGGGGGYKSSVSNQTFTGQTSYTITVGSSGSTSSVKQSNTTICTASGGSNTKSGGSGGGGSGRAPSGGSGQGGTSSAYYPFSSNNYSNYPYCDGGGGGGSITGMSNSYTKYIGGDGGTQGSSGSSATTSSKYSYGGAGGGYYGGAGGGASGSSLSGTASSGDNATGYGSGGGGGGYYNYETETNGQKRTQSGSIGYGSQGIVFIRFMPTS